MARPGRTRLLLAAVTAMAALAPPLLHQEAEARASDRWSRCSDGTPDCGTLGRIELDIGGVRLLEVGRRARGWWGRAEQIEIRPSWSGVDVHVDGLRIERAPSATGSPASAPGSAQPPTTTAQTPEKWRVPNRGIPIRVLAPGVVEAQAGGVHVSIRDPLLEVDAAGEVVASFELAAEHPRGSLRSFGPVTARPTHSPRDWSLDGKVSIAGGPLLGLQADVSPVHASGRLWAADGSLGFELDREATAVGITAVDFMVDNFGQVAKTPIGSGVVDLRGAILSGTATAELAGGQPRVHFAEWSMQGGRVSHPKLSALPIELGVLTLDGDLGRVDDGVSGQLMVEHDGVGIHVSGSASPRGLSVHGELAAAPCQAVLDAIPNGLTGVVAGTQLRGDLDGSIDLEVEFAALHAYHLGIENDPDLPPPGVFEFDVDVLERCEVVADPAAIDLGALSGAYRHRFVDADGRGRTRVMAHGADGYVGIREVPLLAAAFTTLEDARYFRHDGFDRKHIEDALWHNLEVGRIARGASTITQQAARNLFLGVDRTVARKLQEALLATRLEAEVDKKRVLELYLNIIELGPGIHGVEDAAWFHFGKPARKLTAAQAVYIAKLAPAPNTYAKRWAGGRVDDEWMADIRYQTKRMRYYHHITREQMLHSLNSPLGLKTRDR